MLSTFLSSSVDTINWSCSLDVMTVDADADDDTGNDDDEKGDVDELEAPTSVAASSRFGVLAFRELIITGGRPS